MPGKGFDFSKIRKKQLIAQNTESLNVFPHVVTPGLAQKVLDIQKHCLQIFDQL